MIDVYMRKIELELTEHEIIVLTYVISRADSRYAKDPLKDIYEAECKDKDFEPYEALASLAQKLYKACRP